MDWSVVGMNYDWMMLVAKPHVQMGSRPEALMRLEYAKTQPADDGKQYLSQVQWVELDCNKGSWNPLVITSYSANNLSGKEVYSGHGDRANPLWDTPEPTNIFGAAVRMACQLVGK